MKPITDSQQQVLTSIKSFIASNGWPPTLREIQAACGYKSKNSVSHILDALETAGRIRRDPFRMRGITQVDGKRVVIRAAK